MPKASHLRDLIPDPENARQHTPDNVGMIADALREVGAARSGVIDENNVILAGNATYEALSEAGIENVKIVEADGNEWAVVKRTGLSEEQKRRLALFDNRSAELATWNPAMILKLQQTSPESLKGIMDDMSIKNILRHLPIVDSGEDTEEISESESEVLRKKWGTSPGQIWRIGDHRLMCGDATNAQDVARLMNGAQPAITVTDPPYGVNYDPAWRQEAAEAGFLAYAAIRIGEVANDDRLDWTEAWELCPGPVIYCWHAGIHSSEVQVSLMAAGFDIRSQVIWAKSHFPISRGHYHWRHEPCWYAVRKGKTAGWIGDRKQTTLWDDITLDHNAEGGHGTQKPIECMARPIRNHEGDVYDPFIGSGTTMLAAEQLGRRCYGMEIEPKYVAVVLERLEALGLTPELVVDTMGVDNAGQ